MIRKGRAMSKPIVFHWKKQANLCFRSERPAIYVGRPSRWGNPFRIGRDGTREEVIRKFRDSLTEQDLIEIRHDLRGANLGCWCAPKACHADVLLEIANKDEDR